MICARASLGGDCLKIALLPVCRTTESNRLIARSLGDAAYSTVTSDNLERLSVYVEDEPRTTTSGHVAMGGSGNNVGGGGNGAGSGDADLAMATTPRLCGYVTRLNDAIFQPRLHISCRQPLAGRYVYVEASGSWPKEFAAVLCELHNVIFMCLVVPSRDYNKPPFYLPFFTSVSLPVNPSTRLAIYPYK
ncbi:unnamed protein product [Protopolystoma xenopodis]|uniref:Uncharacterized protein n=1 Tax=Protopolystoma xenopodis TaxID=117903 RepID=A0A3S5BWM6_9PLAT|nr:unnamed protein product [Protopolystoma xenopodis]